MPDFLASGLQPDLLLRAAPVLILAAGALVAVMGWVGLRWRAAWLKALEGKAAAQAQGDILRDILATSADGYFLWHHPNALAGTTACSRRLAVMLSLSAGEEAGFSDVLTAFGDSDSDTLNQAVTNLREEGNGFVLDLPLESTGRRMRAVGLRAADVTGRPLADVLWMRDVTEEAQATETLSSRAAALQTERDRLRALLDTLPTPAWSRDDSLAVAGCNRAFARALDLPTPQAAVAARRELADGQAGQEMRALAARSRAAGKASKARFHAVLEGERRLLEVTETPVLSGPLSGHTVAIAQDITAIEEVENRLERETDAHAEVLERLGTAIALFAADTRLGFHNAAFASLWRLDDEWLAAGPSYGDFLERLRENRRLPEVADFPAFKAGELGLFAKLLRPREDILHLPDGATLRRVVAPHPLGGLITTFEDVTDSLALERSYNQLTAVQRETLDHLHEAVAVFDPDGRARLTNPAFVRFLTGDIEGAVPDRRPEAAADSTESPEDAAALDPALPATTLGMLEALDPAMTPGEEWEAFRRRVTARGEGRGPRTGRLVRLDGRTLDYATVPLPDGGLLLSILDVTDRVRVEQALRERSEALRAADQMKSAFIANVSYELRTPLTTLCGFAEILGECYYGPLNDRQKEYAEVIVATARQLGRLIDDITDLVSIDAGNLSLELDAFDVHAALAAVLALGRESARRRGITLSVECPPDTGWMVADETRIKQILYHLMSNAIGHTDPGGEVALAAGRLAQEDQDWMIFIVADTGPGMDPQTQARAFEAFEKGPLSEGAGLGLALVQRFVALHGGTVEMESIPGEGTTVTLRVPAGR